MVRSLISLLVMVERLSGLPLGPVRAPLSILLGNFTLDFSAWSGMLTALRSLIIALSAFVAYRIIFVGNA